MPPLQGESQVVQVGPVPTPASKDKQGTGKKSAS